MQAIGIIAEYDPFHPGHAHLITQARATLGDRPVVVAMSGNWTQRAAAAMFSKHARTEMALRGGADLVLEIPVPWAISSAEGFARGGVSVLRATGVVNTLAFGSECGDGRALWNIAEVLDSAAFPAALQEELSQGQSFPAARQRAVEAILGAAGQDLCGANNLLGVEYCRAIARCGAQMEVFTVPRIGAGHNERGVQGECPSASQVRALVAQGDSASACAQLASTTAEVVHRELSAGRAPASLGQLERLSLYRLRTSTKEDFLDLPDCSEGLENRLHAVARQAASVEEFCALVKTKRYAHSRIRRMVLWRTLEMTRGDIPDRLPYLRVLGMTRRGMELLHKMKRSATVPILTKPAHIHRMGGEAQRLFDLTARTTELWQLCQPVLEQARPGAELTVGPVVLKG